MKRIILIALVALPILALAGCDTLHGMGDDLSNGWHSIFG